MGGTIQDAFKLVQTTTIEDAILFYDAFAHTAVRVNESDELDINDPLVAEKLRERGMTLYDVMAYSAENDMVAREWVNGFSLTRITADRIKEDGRGRDAIPAVFLSLLSLEPDTFIAKKFGVECAREVCTLAGKVSSGDMTLFEFDDYCIREGINPGSLADIMIAGLFVAISEGWEWDR
jgi:triphosphoribosyl-dephospho-CoA synthase